MDDTRGDVATRTQGRFLSTLDCPHTMIEMFCIDCVRQHDRARIVERFGVYIAAATGALALHADPSIAEGLREMRAYLQGESHA